MAKIYLPSKGKKKKHTQTNNLFFFKFDVYFGNLQVWGPNLQVFLDFFSKPPDLHVMEVGRSKHVKELITNKIRIFLNESTFLSMFSFLAKIIQ